MKRLFDDKGFLNIQDIVENHPSFKSIMEDGIVTDEELKTQADKTIAALKLLQDICTDTQQNAIVDAISEMSVLFASYQIYQLQEISK